MIAPNSRFDPARFRLCMDRTDELEGNNVHNQNDWGGVTHRGLTQKVYSEYLSRKNFPDQSVTLATEDERREIFRYGYWEPARCVEFSIPADFVFYQWAINRGTGGAIKDLQASMGLEVDGSFGPRTLQAVKALDGEKQAGFILAGQVARYTEIVNRSNKTLLDACRAMGGKLFKGGKDQREFIIGWVNRVDRVSFMAGLPWRVPGDTRQWAKAQDDAFESKQIPS